MLAMLRLAARLQAASTPLPAARLAPAMQASPAAPGCMHAWPFFSEETPHFWPFIMLLLYNLSKILSVRQELEDRAWGSKELTSLGSGIC